MGLPKKIKKNIPLTQPNTLLRRRQDLVDMINKDGTLENIDQVEEKKKRKPQPTEPKLHKEFKESKKSKAHIKYTNGNAER